MSESTIPENDPSANVMSQVFELAAQGNLCYDEMNMVANIIISLGNYPVAALLYQVWLDNTPSPHVANVYCDLGDLQAFLGNIDTARQAFLRALEAFPGYLRARTGLELCSIS